MIYQSAWGFGLLDGADWERPMLRDKCILDDDILASRPFES
jgi:hypothetical protein